MIVENLNKELINSIKEKNSEKTSFLRVIKGEFERVGKSIPDNDAIAILKKLLDNAQQMNNQLEIEIINIFLPKMLSEDEIKIQIDKIIQENGYSELKQMGLVMKTMKDNFGSLFDGKVASDYIKSKLK